MIYGVGIDFIEIDRIEKVASKFGDRFVNKILSASEWKIYKKSKRPMNYLSKRFAAKEAASKAFGLGFCDGLSFRHFEVFNDVFGKPKLRLFSYAEVLFKELSLSRVHVTLSDDNYYVFAIVIFEK